MKSKANTLVSGKGKSFLKDNSLKQLVILAVLFFVMAMPTFAASSGDSITELDNWADKILELFQSGWVKALLLIALIIEAIGMVLAGQQGGGGQMIKKFAPWIVGTIILLSASSICSYFLGDLSFEVALNSINSGAAVAESASGNIPVLHLSV